MNNKEIAHTLHQIGVFLELLGGNSFRAGAYYKAARTIETLNSAVAALLDTGEIANIRGIGAGLISQLEEMVETGSSSVYDELKSQLPSGSLEMLRIGGLGPKKVYALINELAIHDLDELKQACEEDRVSVLRGFGSKMQSRILEGISKIEKYRGKVLLPAAEKYADYILQFFADRFAADEIILTGALRRKYPIIEKITFLVSERIFKNLPEAAASLNIFIITQNESDIAGQLEGGPLIHFIRSDLSVSDLFQTTGSEKFIVSFFEEAKELSLKEQYKSEEQLFEDTAMPFIPPESRETAAPLILIKKGSYPQPLTLSDIKGVFHFHTTYSDGGETLRSMADECIRLGMKYGLVSDHSISAFYANGLSPQRLIQQADEIRELNKEYAGRFKLLQGSEVEILANGALDFDDDVLQELDMVIASVHSKFTMPEEKMTARIIKAIENPYVKILGHPTGRLLLSREAYPVNIRKVIDAAAANDVVIEINSNPRRLDLDWQRHRYAIEKGVKLCISPDAHTKEGLSDINYGIFMANKGIVPKESLLNCSMPEDFL